MIYWLKHRAGLVLVGVGAVLALLSAVAGGYIIPVPNLGVGLPLAVADLMPIALSVAIASSLARADVGLESTATRRLPAYDLSLVAFATGLSAGLTVVLWLVTGDDHLILFARATVGYAALTLILIRFLEPIAAPPIISLYVITSALMGRNSDGTTALWAWPVAEPTNGIAAVSALVLGAVSALMYLIGKGRRATP